jgi:TRAP-type C4-dicarboxylate transport system permease large subunit
MTNSTKSKIVGLFIGLFAIVLPLIIVFSMYMSLETTTSTMAINIIGVFLLLGIALGSLKLFKRRIKLRKEMGFIVSPYYIAFSFGYMSVVGAGLFTWFLFSVRDDVDKLAIVMALITICQAFAFALKFVQVYFDKKVLAEQTQT